MAGFQNVAVSGKGALGTIVVTELLASGYTVTVLTRSKSSIKDIPTGVKVAEVDYESTESLVAALKGNDVLINTVGMSGIPLQRGVIDAAIAAGVKRYVPADYGSLTADPEAQKLPVHGMMADVQNYLKQLAAEGKIEWTVFQTGAFLDFIVGFVPFAYDLPSKTITWMDEGEVKISATTTGNIGKAVASALGKREETKNRVVYVQDVQVSQKELVGLARKYVKLGPGEEWKEERQNTGVELQRWLGEAEKGNFGMDVMMGMLKAAIMSGKYRSAFKETDNELLGLGQFKEGDLEAYFAEKFQ